MSGHWPADRVERRALAALVPYARNARTHSEEQVRQIAGSIEEWGFTVPVLVDSDGVIVAGHGRVLAAESLGLVEVPVVVCDGWSDAQKRAYRLADNRIAERSSWDESMLASELAALGDFAVDLAGFSDEDLAALTSSVDTEIGAPPQSVRDNVEELEKFQKERRKGNAEFADSRDTERYLVVVFKSRADREAAMRRLGLPEDERYVVAESVEVRSRFAKADTPVASRPIIAATSAHSGATG